MNKAKIRPRAVRFDRYGDLDVLYIAEVDPAIPAAGEVIVQTRAAGINPGETLIRSGSSHDRFPANFPSGQGSDLAGTITTLGAGVTAFSVGEQVMGWSHRRSSHADFIAVPQPQLITKPWTISWEVAGSLYVVGCTAYAAVRAINATPGETVAVSAATGGVGAIVTQLLKVKGVRVLGIASPASEEYLTRLGATPIHYGPGLADRLRAAAPGGIDAFIDLFGPDYVELAISLGIRPDRINTIIARDAARKYKTRSAGSMAATTTHVLAELAELVGSGRVTFPIAATYPLERVHDAYAELERRHTHGKIVLVP